MEKKGDECTLVLWKSQLHTNFSQEQSAIGVISPREVDSSTLDTSKVHPGRASEHLTQVYFCREKLVPSNLVFL